MRARTHAGMQGRTGPPARLPAYAPPLACLRTHTHKRVDVQKRRYAFAHGRELAGKHARKHA
eukprot:14947293-Alexandrium_andersonii.AAC.1